MSTPGPFPVVKVRTVIRGSMWFVLAALRVLHRGPSATAWGLGRNGTGEIFYPHRPAMPGGLLGVEDQARRQSRSEARDCEL